MEIRNGQQNLGFGTAFVNFNQKRLYELPKHTQVKVTNLLTKGFYFMSLSNDFIVSATLPNKQLKKSLYNGNTALNFTHENPAKENQLVKIFKKLFDNKDIDAYTIDNTPENAKLIEELKHKQQNWVISGD
ncbi:MAG: hypothetical protein WCG23_12170 [bacterium]